MEAPTLPRDLHWAPFGNARYIYIYISQNTYQGVRPCGPGGLFPAMPRVAKWPSDEWKCTTALRVTGGRHGQLTLLIFYIFYLLKELL